MTTAVVPHALDAALLTTLERAFARHAGTDDKIDIADLQRALGLRSEYLTRRVLDAFDENGDGVISREEFLSGVRALVFGDDREKLRFAFQLHDHDGDGFLDRDELLRMIAISLAESDVSERVSQPPSQLASALLAAANRSDTGRVAFDDFEKLVRQRPDLLSAMTRSEAIWLAPNEELLLLLDDASERRGRLTRLLENHGARVAFLAFWILANAGVVVWSMTYGRAHATSSAPMQIGRAVGACLDLNGALIFVPMMRRMLTRLRATWMGRVFPIDDAIGFHKVVGHTMFALAGVHTAAFVLAYGAGHPDVPKVLETERGLTGGLLFGVFAVMWLFSLGFVRRSKHFELFYFTHLLYFAWLGLALAHAPRLVAFAGVPFAGIVIEQLVRVLKRRPPSKVLSTWPLRSGVTRLEIERPPRFKFHAGDYVFLRIPAIARHEWHPYTISSAPELPTLTVHARSLGNWSGALRRLVEQRRHPDIVAYIDGPYGSPTGHIFRSRFAVLIGAGIGVTPFASVLESMVLRSTDAEEDPSRPKRPTPEKVHFFWLNRDQYSFEWFRGLLSRLEERDERGLLETHLCMTGARSGATALGLELAREAMHAAGRADIVTGLRTKTHMGHPDWEAMLARIVERHAPAKVDVFYCGPHGLARKLSAICQKLGMTFREERF